MILKLRHYRLKNNMSIRELSRLTGISRTYISDIEHGKYENIGVKSVCILCKQFNITPNDLINKEYWSE